MSPEEPEFGFDALSKKLERELEEKDDELTATGNVEELTPIDYSSWIGKAKTAVIVFYQTNCQYCAQLLPILDDFAKEYEKKIFFGKMNIDEFEEDVLDEYDVYSVPLVIAFKKNMSVGRLEGLKTLDVYDDWIEGVYKGIRPMS